MTLAEQIRAGVAAAASATGAVLVEVTHERKTGEDGDGKPTFAAGTEHDVFVQTKQNRVVRLIGPEKVDGPSVLFLENKVVAVGDQITLPDGTVATVQGIDSVADPAGGVFFTDAQCGRPIRGSLT